MIIETKRLRLRRHRLEDFAACAAMWADPVVTRYIGGKPLAAEDVWSRLLRYAGHWDLLGYGYWVLEERATGLFAGEVGFADFRRDIDPPLGAPELGWVLASRIHGRGYATEAVQAAIAWANRHLPGPRTVCIINPENVASIRVAEKCGHREVRRASYKGHPVIVFEREAPAG